MRIEFLAARMPSPRSQAPGAVLALDVCCFYLLNRLDEKHAARTGMCLFCANLYAILLYTIFCKNRFRNSYLKIINAFSDLRTA